LSHLKADKKRCKGVTKSGEPCPAWAMEGGLCYFHANPDKAAELGRNGGRRRKHTYEQSAEAISPPESAADVRRMLAETMADVNAGRMDPKVANTVAYVGTILLRAYKAEAAHSADTPTKPYVPLIYRALMLRDGLKPEPDDVIDLNTGERVALPCALPARTPSAAQTGVVQPREEIEVEILDY
jgi:hypothetical protein